MESQLLRCTRTFEEQIRPFLQRDTAYRMIPRPRCNVESVGVVSLTNLHFFADQAESESSIADREEWRMLIIHQDQLSNHIDGEMNRVRRAIVDGNAIPLSACHELFALDISSTESPGNAAE